MRRRICECKSKVSENGFYFKYFLMYSLYYVDCGGIFRGLETGQKCINKLEIVNNINQS